MTNLQSAERKTMKMNERSILVTGGTGSFGQQFVKDVLKLSPERVVVYSRDELKQYEMQQTINAPQLRYFIGDVRDADRLRLALRGINTVVHAAALKQVVAAEYNPIECIKTNVLGAENIVNACMDAGVRDVIALSTDKAVNPINLYGATKLCSDKLFVAANHLVGHPRTTRFSVVRYGNVIGSRGSVVPLFKKLASTGTLPITDPQMTRFWITIEAGVKFVINCLNMMRGGEVFVPKIGSMRIIDLAKGMAPDCRHEVVGIRPGEKLHETLIPQEESSQTLELTDFYVIRPSISLWQGDVPNEYGGEVGQPVSHDFEYVSDTNPDQLTTERLSSLLRDIG